MQKEKIKLIIRNMELLIDALKVELLSDEHQTLSSHVEDDYDEIYNEEI